MDVYVRKYWEEEDILYFIHFQNGHALRQIEQHPEQETLYLSLDDPDDAAHLADQPLEELEISIADHISKEEFETAWQKQFN